MQLLLEQNSKIVPIVPSIKEINTPQFIKEDRFGESKKPEFSNKNVFNSFAQQVKSKKSTDSPKIKSQQSFEYSSKSLRD